MSTNRDVFRDEWWIDISFQLLCFGLLDASNFDGPLLRSDIPNGIWLRNQLNRIYQEHAPTQRSTVHIQVLQPDFVLSQCFTLMLEVMVRRSQVTRFYTFPEPFGSVAPPVTAPAPASTAQVPTSAAPAPGVSGPSSSGGGGGLGGSGGFGGGEVPGPSSSGGDGVFGGSATASGSWGSGGSGGLGGSGVPGGSGGL